MSIEALRGVIDEAVLLLAPLVEAAQSPDDLLRLLAKLGWTPASVPQPLADLATAGGAVLDVIDADTDEVSAPEVLTAIGRLIDAINAINAQPENAFPDGVDIAAFKQTIARDLLDYCVVEYLLRHRFRIGRLLKLMGIVRLFEVPASGARQAYVKRFVDWGGMGTLLTNPMQGFRAAYDWDRAAPQLPHVLSDIAEALEAWGLELSYFVLSDAQLAFVAAGANPPPTGQIGICLDLGEALGVPPEGQAGVQFVVRPATAARGPAIAIMPYAQLGASSATADDTLPSLSISADADLTQGFAITLEPGHPPVVDTGYLAGVPSASGATDLVVQLRVPPAPDAPERVLVGSADSSRLSLHTATVSAGVALAQAQSLEAFVEIGLERLRVVIKSDDADSFIANLLGSGLSTELSLVLRLSSVSGFHVAGSVGVEANFPLSLQLGPVNVQALTIALQAATQGVDLKVGATLIANLGPVAIVADRTGFVLAMRFPDPPNGNLGPVDLSLDFLPPSAIGVAIDAGGIVSGGGFIYHDPDNALYAGVLQLSVHETINLTAFGLIATRLPDGSKGYSLIVFITADGFEPIQLGLGFTLLGIGGMVAVNRTFDESVLRDGLKNDTLGKLLFPSNPVANAPAIIRSLGAAFPARSGSYMVGLLVRIGWFTPPLVTADLALIVEFGARKRLLVLGRVRALLPSPDHALLRITLDAIGVFDFDAGTAAIDAVLVDSRLLERFVISGAAALRARWSSPRSFALAVGGMNKGFAPPADFPVLERVTLSLTTGDNPRLTCESYFALTSNTVQFGAAAHLYAAAYGFSVVGDAGYDVLIQLDPFHFLADFFASMQLKRGSDNLFKVSVDGTLEGPAPLTVRAKCSFEILWWDVTIRVNATLAEGTTPPLPQAVNVLDQLKAALGDARNWHAELPPQQTRVVTLTEAADKTTLRVHPLGTLSVRQGVVPLNLERDIDRYGEAPVAGSRRFAVGAVTLGGGPAGGAPVRDDFAPAQFFEMSDEAKLAAPSYESMDAGVAFGAPDYAFELASGLASPLDYETVIVDAQAAPDEVPPPYRLSDVLLDLHASVGAAGRSALRSVAASRPTPFATLNSPGFAVIDDALKPIPQSTGLSFAEAAAIASTAATRLRTVPAFEITT